MEADAAPLLARPRNPNLSGRGGRISRPRATEISLGERDSADEGDRSEREVRSSPSSNPSMKSDY